MRKHIGLFFIILALLPGCDRSSIPLPRLVINEVMARNESFSDFETSNPVWTRPWVVSTR